MAEKIFNVRIRNKYDSYENWAASSLVLEAGEIATAYTTVNVTVDNGTIEKHPALLMKVGDGEKTFANLPWLSAKAADVAAWAKAAEKPTYEAKEITGMEQYIADYVKDEMGISVDTDTLYQIVKVDDYNYKLQSKGKTDEAWADVANSAIVIPNDTAAIEALEDLVGDTKVATQIANAIAELDLANTYAAKEHEHTKADITDFAHNHEMSEVNGLADALAGLQAKGDYAAEVHGHEIADVTGLADAIADAKKAGTDAQTYAEGVAGDLATLSGKVGEVPADKTVVQMIADAQAAATYDDTALAGRVGELETLVGDEAVADQISQAVAAEAEIARAAEKANADAIDAIEADYLKAADKTELQNQINTIMNNPDTEGVINSINEFTQYIADHGEIAEGFRTDIDANKAAIEKLNGDASTAGSVDKKIADAIAAENLAQYATDEDLNTLAGRVEAVEGDLNTETTGLKARMTAAEADIDALETKVGDTAVSEQITSAVNEEMARAKAAEEANAAAAKAAQDDVDALEQTVAAIKIDTLDQTEGTTLIFDCGGAGV